MEAGAKLLSNHGPKALTIKWVAKEAAVPSEWLEARWADMNALLADVLDYEGRQLSTASPAIPVIHGDPFTPAADGLLNMYDRIAVRAILDGVEPANLQSCFPTIERLIAELREDGMEDSTARARAFQVALLELGWRLLGPTLASACGLTQESADETSALVRSLQRTLADPSFHWRPEDESGQA